MGDKIPQNVSLIQVKEIYPAIGEDKELQEDQKEVIKKRCPFASGKNATELPEIKVSEKDIKKMPYKRGFLFLNLISFKMNGYTFYKDLERKFKSTVFKVKLNTDRIILNDHKSIRYMYDLSKVKREEGFGFMKFNSTMLENFVPSIFANGPQHDKQKQVIMKYFGHILSELNLKEVIEITKTEFENMKKYKDLSFKEAKKLDIEDVIDNAVCNVVTKLMLGKSLNFKLLEEYLEKVLEFEYDFDLTDADEIETQQKIFQIIKDTPHILKLDQILGNLEIDRQNVIKEIIWVVIFNAFGGLKNLILSELLSLIRLSHTEKLLIVSEINKFLNKNEFTFEALKTLSYCKAFFLETCRLFPPAAGVFGSATKDFVLESTSGYFQIQKGDLLCGNVYGAQRDPRIYKNPNEFSLRRPLDLLKQYNFTFGGVLNEDPSHTNHKCIGQDLAETISKVFLIFFTKCTVIPLQHPNYTGKVIERLAGSDKPLRIKSFYYNPNDPYAMFHE